jgi:hypothetical protein
LPHETWGYASLYTPLHNIGTTVPDGGWQPIELDFAFWGALAYCFTRESLTRVLRSKIVRQHQGDRDTDMVVTAALKAMGRRRYFHVPSLGEHTGGGVSSIGHVQFADMAAVGYSPHYRGYVPNLATKLPGKLAIVTSYFNPAGYQAIRRNYRRFSAALARQDVDLWTVEIAFGAAPFEFDPTSRVKRFRTPDVLWQKERAFNCLIESLPDRYDKVAWVDADVIFTNRRWAQDVAGRLEEFPVVQCFAKVNHLGPDRQSLMGAQVSMAREIAQRQGGDSLYSMTPGFAWAARRELIARHGLYDREITGGNDLAMAIGFYGWWNHPYLRTLPARLRDDIRRWGARVWADVQGHVGYVDGELLHLYHGPFRNRQYEERTRPLVEQNFNPRRDIVVGPGGLFSWSTVKPRLHEAMRDYFDRRNDDE